MQLIQIFEFFKSSAVCIDRIFRPMSTAQFSQIRSGYCLLTSAEPISGADQAVTERQIDTDSKTTWLIVVNVCLIFAVAVYFLRKREKEI